MPNAGPKAIKDAGYQEFGELSYNDYKFPILRQVNTSFEVLYDSADRAYQGTKYHVEVVAWIVSDTVTNSSATFDTIRQQLTKPGGVLTIKGMGFKDIVVGGPKGQRDLKWGPKPRMGSIHPVGGGIAFEFKWSVEFTIVDCGQSAQYLGARIIGFNNAVIYDIDLRGLTTRSVVGYYEIALDRQSIDKIQLTVTADNFRGKINVPVPPNFSRVRNSWQMSEDRTRMQFQIVDAELETDDPLPNGIVGGHLDYSLENAQDKNFMLWNLTVAGSFERRAGLPRAWGFKMFFLCLSGIVAKLRRPSFIGDANGSPSVVFPKRISVVQETCSRNTSFSAAFQIAVSPLNIMALTGIFDPVPNSNYAVWAQSMQDVWSNRGLAKMAHDASRDFIVEACNTNPQTTVNSTNDIVQAPPSPLTLLGCDNVTTDNCTLFYRVWYEMGSKTPTAVHNPIQVVQQPVLPAGNPNAQAGGGIPMPQAGANPPIVQLQGAPRLFGKWRGRVSTLKYQPTIPDDVPAEDWEGMKVTTTNKKSSMVCTTKIEADCCIWVATWEYDFTVVTGYGKGKKVAQPKQAKGN